ncbi:hypothetical protein [Parashewanella curva]|uniref:hypothetical protein n=1 Tax=Parashewanella curva TaxID=2338552 RepID=UPI00105A69BE|nr:hypothetical protein [Parashewanella curva]
MFAWVAEYWHQFKYLLLQAGVITIILLAVPYDESTVSTNLSWYRALGSLEGGLVSLVIIYVSRLYSPDLDE